jgi:hypothetical protein
MQQDVDRAGAKGAKSTRTKALTNNSGCERASEQVSHRWASSFLRGSSSALLRFEGFSPLLCAVEPPALAGVAAAPAAAAPLGKAVDEDGVRVTCGGLDFAGIAPLARADISMAMAASTAMAAFSAADSATASPPPASEGESARGRFDVLVVVAAVPVVVAPCFSMIQVITLRVHATPTADRTGYHTRPAS